MHVQRSLLSKQPAWIEVLRSLGLGRWSARVSVATFPLGGSTRGGSPGGVWPAIYAVLRQLAN